MFSKSKLYPSSSKATGLTRHQVRSFPMAHTLLSLIHNVLHDLISIHHCSKMIEALICYSNHLQWCRLLLEYLVFTPALLSALLELIVLSHLSGDVALYKSGARSCLVQGKSSVNHRILPPR
jgi:hypothetical protein